MTPVGTAARRPGAVQRSSAVGLPPRGRARRESAGTDAVLPWESTRPEHTSTVHHQAYLWRLDERQWEALSVWQSEPQGPALCARCVAAPQT